MRLWVGQSVSEIGSAITLVALPLTAVLALKASVFEVGLLSSATTLPFLLIALPAGLIVDRIPKRRLMIGCDMARMLIIGSVPVAYALHQLTLAQLYGVALTSGILTVFFDVAYQSYVPYLVGREQLLDGNGKIGATQSFAQVAGPGLGGALYGLLKAGAMTANAASYGVSWLALLMIRTRELPPQPRADAAPTSLRTELLAGLMFVVRHPILRKIAACTATANLFGTMAFALEIIFMVRVLHIHAGYTGLIIAIGGMGGVLGGICSKPIGRLVGTARIIWVAMLGFGFLGLLVPLAEPGWRLVLLPIGIFMFSLAAVLYNIAQLSYRQSICPPELLGRMNAAIRWIVWGTLPLGGFVGGLLGSHIGVRPTIWLGVAGAWAAGFWLLASPLRSMRDIPTAGRPADGGLGRAGDAALEPT
jgi:predicted MFS family arabinose efflux permease